MRKTAVFTDELEEFWAYAREKGKALAPLTRRMDNNGWSSFIRSEKGRRKGIQIWPTPDHPSLKSMCHLVGMADTIADWRFDKKYPDGPPTEFAARKAVRDAYHAFQAAKAEADRLGLVMLELQFDEELAKRRRRANGVD